MSGASLITGSNRHCVLKGIQHVEIEERPIPQPGPNDVLVQVISSGICGTDVSYYSKGKIGTSVVLQPHVLGHESCGIIQAVGEKVSGLKVGDRVAIEPGLPCHECRFCREGSFNYCRNEEYMAAPHTDGTLCQWYACPARNAVLFPDNITWEEAGCIQPLAIAIQVARRSGLRAHDNVVVFGAGPIGLLCMAVARAYGARTITAVEVSESRLEFAKKYAATHGIIPPPRPADRDPLEFANEVADDILRQIGNEFGADVVIETTAAESCMHIGVSVLRTGGTFLQAGLGAALVNFPILLVATKEIKVIGAFHYTPRCFEDGIDLLERGLVSVKNLVTKTFPLTKAEDAFHAVKSGKEIKVVIMNQE